MHRSSTLLLVISTISLLSGSAISKVTESQPVPSFSARCNGTSVTVCRALDSEAEVANLRYTPTHLKVNDRVQWDSAANAARFTVPPYSPADSSGHLHIAFPNPMTGVYFSFDARYSSDMLRYRFKGAGGWKMFILGQGKEGCAPYEIVGQNSYFRGYPSFYYKCGENLEVAIPNPFGDNTSQFDYQPGGDTACFRTARAGSKPCALFEPDSWVTYQVHVDALASVLEVWQTVRGKTLKIIDFQLKGFPLPPPKYEWLKLTPYDTGKDATEDHPTFFLWYRRVIVSSRPIAFPVTD